MLARPIYVIDGARTPFLKSKNRPGPFAASDLATQAGRALLARQRFSPDELDEVILGCAAPSVDEVNIGRVAALRMGCGQKVPAWTVMRNCASGMQVIDSGINNILAGRASLVLAGGVDALSRAPLLYGDKMVLWCSNMAAARSAGQTAAAGSSDDSVDDSVDDSAGAAGRPAVSAKEVQPPRSSRVAAPGSSRLTRRLGHQDPHHEVGDPAGRQHDMTVLEECAVLIAEPIEGREHIAGEAAGFLEHAADIVGAEIAVKAVIQSAAHPG